MPKYRLTWQGGGALDLSQVLDERGVPVLFTKTGDSVVVDGGTYQHPLVQRYVGNGLAAEEADTKAAAAPAPTPAPPPAAKPKPAPEPKTEPPPEPSPPIPEPEPEPEKVEVKDTATMGESPLVTSAKDEASDSEEKASDTIKKTTTKKKGGKRGGRSSK